MLDAADNIQCSVTRRIDPAFRRRISKLCEDAGAGYGTVQINDTLG